MDFQYSNKEVWKKRVRNSIFNAISGLFVVGVSLYLYGRVEGVFIYTSSLLFGIGLFQTIYYLRMPEKDYIRFKKNYMSIRRGFAVSPLKIGYDEIERVQQIDDIISIRTIEKDEDNLYLEYLTEGDVRKLLIELERRLGSRMNEFAGEESG
ncbi:hypothetical protein [Halobacillus litoralis]|nr:hypothetical protein [Halobacillus litoralis]